MDDKERHEFECGEAWYPPGWDPKTMDWRAEQMPEKQPSQKIVHVTGRSIWLPVGLVATLLLLAIGVTWRVALVVNRMDSRLERIEAVQSGTWTVGMMESYAWSAERTNLEKGYRAPDVRAIYESHRGRVN